MKKRILLFLFIIIIAIIGYIGYSRDLTGWRAKNPMTFDMEKVAQISAVFKDEPQIDKFWKISGRELGKLRTETLSDYAFHGKRLYVVFSTSDEKAKSAVKRRLVVYDLWTKSSKTISENISTSTEQTDMTGLTYTSGKLYWVELTRSETNRIETYYSFDLTFHQSMKLPKPRLDKISDARLLGVYDSTRMLNQNVLTETIDYGIGYNINIIHKNGRIISHISIPFDSPFPATARSDGSTAAFGCIRTQGLLVCKTPFRSAMWIGFEECLNDRRGLLPYYILGNKIITNGPGNRNFMIYDVCTNIARPMLSRSKREYSDFWNYKSMNGKLTIVQEQRDILIER